MARKSRSKGRKNKERKPTRRHSSYSSSSSRYSSRSYSKSRSKRSHSSRSRSHKRWKKNRHDKYSDKNYGNSSSYYKHDYHNWSPKNEDSSPLHTDQNDEKLENGWQDILESLRYTKGQKFNLKALLVTCTTRKLENDSIILGFSHPSHRERMEHELTIPESRKTLSDAFTKIMNKQYELAVEKDNVSLREKTQQSYN